jgi:hypothetical protein
VTPTRLPRSAPQPAPIEISTSGRVPPRNAASARRP